MRFSVHSWTTLFTKRRIGRKKRRNPSRANYGRRLSFEQCEDRRLLTSSTVNSLDDVNVFNFTDSVVTLREAIELAEQDPAADIIDFSTDPIHNLDGGTILLEFDEYDITEAVTIDASMLSSLTINAGDGADEIFGTGDGTSAFFIILTPSQGEVQEVTIDGLTIKGGDSSDTSGETLGGGIGFVGNSTATNSQAKLTIRNSIITGNHTESLFRFGGGGGIYAAFYGNEASLDIQNSEISNNTSTSFQQNIATGGGGLAVFTGYDEDAGNATINISNTSITGNSSATKGGGAFLRLSQSTVTISDSTISGNESLGTSTETAEKDGGGGLYLRIGIDDEDAGSSATIANSTISGNEAVNDGGGVFALLYGDDENDDSVSFTIKNSTVSGNDASDLSGGGIYICEKHGGTFIADHTTVSGNSANTRGGGISLARSTAETPTDFDATMKHSTITGNSAPEGGGLFSAELEQVAGYDNIYHSAPVNTKLSHTIISGNDDGNEAADNITGAIDEAMSRYNLVGPGDVMAADLTGPGNIDNPTNDPGLLSLILNGGPTQTHEPISTSPAVDMGEDPYSGSAAYDQRGEPFDRVFGARIDIGAVELQPSADFDVDGDVDGSNFLTWQRGFGTVAPNATKEDGDADGDTDVDGDDLAIWETQFGRTSGMAAGSSSAQSGGSGPGFASGDNSPSTGSETVTVGSGTGGSSSLTSNAQLLYDPSTGNVQIDANGNNLLSIVLTSDDGFSAVADFTDLDNDVIPGLSSNLVDNTTSIIGWVSVLVIGENGFDGPGLADLGTILPTGLNAAELASLLTEATFTAGLGVSGQFELEVIDTVKKESVFQMQKSFIESLFSGGFIADITGDGLVDRSDLRAFVEPMLNLNSRVETERLIKEVRLPVDMATQVSSDLIDLIGEDKPLDLSVVDAPFESDLL